MVLGTRRNLAAGGWKTGEGHIFFQPFKREGYGKNDRKIGRVMRNYANIIVNIYIMQFLQVKAMRIKTWL